MESAPPRNLAARGNSFRSLVGFRQTGGGDIDARPRSSIHPLEPAASSPDASAPEGVAAPQSIRGQADLAGSLSNIGLEAVLQVLAGIGKTGILIVKDGRGRGRGHISLRDGKLLEVVAGNERGISAMVEILALEHGFFQLRDLNSVERLRLRFHEAVDLMGMLLDAHRVLDERNAALAERRPVSSIEQTA